MNDNEAEDIAITPAELAHVRSLDNFDLTLFLSELHDHGWPIARKLLTIIEETHEFRAGGFC